MKTLHERLKNKVLRKKIQDLLMKEGDLTFDQAAKVGRIAEQELMKK